MTTYETVEDQIKSIADSLKPATYQESQVDLLTCANNLPHAILIAARMVCHAVNKDPERADRLFWEALGCLVEGFSLEDGVLDTEKMKQWLLSDDDDRTTPATDI